MSGFWWENRAGAGVVDFGPFWPQEPPSRPRRPSILAKLTAVNFDRFRDLLRRFGAWREARRIALSGAKAGPLLTAVNLGADTALQDDEKNSSTPPAGHPIMAAGGAS